MTKITVNVSAQVENGQQVGSSMPLEVNAIDWIEETIAPTKEVEINVQPSASKDVQLLLIQANGTFGEGKLTYGVAAANEIALDAEQSHLYVGSTITKLGNDVKKLKFKNDEAAPAANEKPKEAKVKILIGRDPTP